MRVETSNDTANPELFPYFIILLGDDVQSEYLSAVAVYFRQTNLTFRFISTLKSLEEEK